MKSRTSSCKAAAFRKDITRFWPVWALYILFLIFLQVILGNEEREYWYLRTLANSLQVMGFANACFALVVAQMLFGDLFNTRMCNGIHSLPLKREHWFDVHVKSGLLFSLVPTALMTAFVEAAMVSGTIIVDGWQIPLYWWAACNLQYVFFFGLAVFCVMCIGNRFAAVVVYGGLNCFSLLVFLLTDAFYTPLLHGVVTQAQPFKLLSPAYSFGLLSLIDISREATGKTYLDKYGVEQREYIGSFRIAWEDCTYLAVLVVIGIVLMVLARQMYKKRNLEKAGDFMAVKWLEPVFQVAFTVACAAGVHGAFFTFFGYAYSDNYVMAGLGLIAGWFAGRMFLERSTRVFRVKNFGGLILLTAAVALSLFVTKLDPLGIEDWVPEQGKVQSASLRLSHQSTITTEDPEEIKQLLHIHALALEDKITVPSDYNDYFYNGEQDVAHITLTYRLDNGWISQRNYYIDPNSEAGGIIRNLTSRIEVALEGSQEFTLENSSRPMVIRDAGDLKYAMKFVTQFRVSGQWLPEEYFNEEFLDQLVDALQADAEAGNLVPSLVYHPECFADYGEYGRLNSIFLDFSSETFHFSLSIYTDCEHTVALLESTGVIDTILEEYAADTKG